MEIQLAVVRLELDSDSNNCLEPPNCSNDIMKIQMSDKSVGSPPKILMNGKKEESGCDSSFSVSSIKGVTDETKENRNYKHQPTQHNTTNTRKNCNVLNAQKVTATGRH